MDKPQKILLIQLKRAGDVLVTTPVVPALQQIFPQAQIDWLVDRPFAPLLENNPHLHRVFPYDRQKPWKTVRALRAERYDWIIDFQSSPRSILAGLFAGAKVRAGYRVTFWGHFLNHAMKRPGQGLLATEGKMNLIRTLAPELGAAGDRNVSLTAAERSWAAKTMKQPEGERTAVGLIPTHRRSSRRWEKSSFVELGKLLSSRGMPVWLFWGPGEEGYVADIQRQIPKSHMIPNASLREMASLLERCRLVVTNDNGPMHLAVAVGVPTVTVYGPTDPQSWNPGGPKHRVVQATHVPCLGCNLNVCPFGHECMTEVTPQHMMKQVDDLLEKVLVNVS